MRGLIAAVCVAGLIRTGVGDGVKVSERFGFDPADATANVQAALDSGETTITLDRQAGDWIISKTLNGRSNQKIVFEKGAYLRAKEGCFKGKTECLISFYACTNVTLTGPDPKACGIVMRRDDYADRKKYAWSEWRHGISLRSCVNVLLEGIGVCETGGDGLYVAAGGPTPEMRRGCRNVTIRRCVFDRNHRQGISVIGVDGMLIEDTELTNTKGTPPESGIDFEPNRAEEALCGIVMRRCLVKGNAGKGLDISHQNSAANTPPCSFLFEDCLVEDNRFGFIYGTGTHDPEFPADAGSVIVRGCTFRNAKGTALGINKRINLTGKVLFENCLIENCCTEKPEKADIELSTTGHTMNAPDEVTFRNVKVIRPVERPLLSHAAIKPYRGKPTRIAGEITCVTAGKEEIVRYDDAWREANFPWRDVTDTLPLARVPAPIDRVRTYDAQPGAMLPCAPVFVRGYGPYHVFYAEKARRVTFTVEETAVGKNGYGKAGEIEIRAFGQERILAKYEPPRDSACLAITFEAPKAGFYTVSFRGAGNGFAITAADVPLALDATTKLVPLVGPADSEIRRRYGKTRPRLSFEVKKGTTFECVVAGDGAERVEAELVCPEGTRAAYSPSVVGVERFKAEPLGGTWTLVLGKPEQGAYEDHSISLRGIPGWFFLTPGRGWR